MADRFVLLDQNYAVSAVLSGGSWLSGLSLENLKDMDLGLVARSTNALNASTIVRADLGAPRSVGGLVFCSTNVTPGATYRWRGYSNSAFSTLVYDGSIRTVPGSRIDWSSTANWLAWEDPGFWFGIRDVFDSSEDGLPVNLVELLPSDVTARYWQGEIFDAGNGDGGIDISYLMIARAFRPGINYSYGAESNVEELKDEVESLGGKITQWLRAKRRVSRVSFEWLTEAESFGTIFRLQYSIGTGKPVFLIPDPDDTTYFQQRSYLATLKTSPPIVQAQFQRDTTVLDCKEVI